MMRSKIQASLLAKQLSGTLTDLLKELMEDPETVEIFEEIHPDLWEDLADQGYICLELDQIPQATAIFEFLLYYHPEEVAYQAAFADALNAANRFDESSSYYEKAILSAPEIPDAYFYLAENHMVLRQPNEALPRLHTTLELTTPDHQLHEQATQRLEYAQDAINNPLPPLPTDDELLEETLIQ